MKLTKPQALDLTHQLWTWLAETGSTHKHLWPGWKEYLDFFLHDCPLCEYSRQQITGIYDTKCDYCPYSEKFNRCYFFTQPFKQWDTSITTTERIYHAKVFLSQIKELIDGKD